MNSEFQSRIRRAVSAGDFVTASTLWETYARQAAGEIRSGNCSAAQLAQIRELIDWTRGAAICTRAHAQLRLNHRRTELHAAAAYGQRFR